MHTVNNLFNTVISKENLYGALFDAARGKRKKRTVRYAIKHAEEVVDKLHSLLADGKWRPCTVHRVKVINDGVSLKKREIVCPEFINEQIVHHAIMRVIKTYIIKRFYRYSCASVPGRGVEYAIKYIRRSLKDHKGTKYFTVIDIRQFFNSIKPSKVAYLLRRIFRDKRLLMLLFRILRANKVITGGGVIKRGAPIGFYTSPWFANILLTPLDNIIKQHIKYYVRYNDDMLLMSSNKRKLTKTLKEVKRYLASVGLTLKSAIQIHMTSKVKISYIGATISYDKIVLQAKTFLRACRVARRIKAKGKITIYDARRIISISGRFKHYNAYMAYKRYIEGCVPRKKCRQIIRRHSKYVGSCILERKTYNQRASR